jgi:hypothetical protein
MVWAIALLRAVFNNRLAQALQAANATVDADSEVDILRGIDTVVDHAFTFNQFDLQGVILFCQSIKPALPFIVVEKGKDTFSRSVFSNACLVITEVWENKQFGSFHACAFTTFNSLAWNPACVVPSIFSASPHYQKINAQPGLFPLGFNTLHPLAFQTMVRLCEPGTTWEGDVPGCCFTDKVRVNGASIVGGYTHCSGRKDGTKGGIWVYPQWTQLPLDFSKNTTLKATVAPPAPVGILAPIAPPPPPPAPVNVVVPAAAPD